MQRRRQVYAREPAWGQVEQKRGCKLRPREYLMAADE